MKKSKVDYEIILVICLMLLLFSLLLDLRYLAWTSLCLGLTTLLIKPLGRLLVMIWTKILHAIGYINSRVILSIVFYLLLFPIALLARLFRKEDPLKLKQSSESYWSERTHKYQPRDLENPW